MRMESFARKRTELHLVHAWAADARGDFGAALAAYVEAVRSRPRLVEEAAYSTQGDPYFGEAVGEQTRLYWVAHGRSEADLVAAVGERDGVRIDSSRGQVMWFPRRVSAPVRQDFQVVDLNGRQWTKADFTGKSGFLAIWPARHEWYWKNLASLASGLDASTPFLALAVDGNAAIFEQVAKREKLSFAIASPDLPLAQRLTRGMTAPQVCLVDARGNLLKCAVGPFPTDGSALPEFRKALDEARNPRLP
jgi:hypothetical protein